MGTMPPLHVMLDTSILRDDPQRRKAAVVRFEQLARQKHVMLHLPWLVQEEFISGMVDAYRKSLRDAKASLQSVPGLVLDRLGADLKQRVTALRTEVASIVREDFQRWLTEINAEIHHATGDHTTSGLAEERAAAIRIAEQTEQHVDAEEEAVLDIEGRLGILAELPDSTDDRDVRQVLLAATMSVEDVRIIRVRLASME